jgi:glycosyltransferase involved in cell wall biosynthesis
LRVLHTISGIWKHTGGPAETVPRLCSALVEKEIDVILTTLEGPLSEAALECKQNGVDLRTYSHHWQFSLKITEAIKEIARNIDIIHGHGLWLPINWATGFYARKYNKPFVITTRGALNPNALSHSHWKKKIAGFLFDNRNLQSADCIHVTSLGEYEAIRSYGLRKPVAVIPNGIEIPYFDKNLLRHKLTEKYPKLKGKKIILYLSRISWEKGLPLLAEAWANVSADFKNWHLLIGGQGPQKYENEIKKLFSEKGLSERVTWAGLLLGEEKLSALVLAELFVLPTLSENFGIAIAEALSTGIPVITTQGAPWHDLIEWKCGWWIPIDASHLANALREALALPDSVRQEMGENGKRLIQSKYTWEQVASQMTAVYDWIIRKDKPPHCVKID